VLILTKVAMWPKQPGLSAANIEAAVEGSLKRLQTDYIDLYQSHQDDAETPLDETLEAFDRLVKAGKVRAVGASNFSPERLKASLDTSKAKGLARYETIQPKFNLIDREQVEGALADLTQRRGLGIIPFYGLAAGFLSGKYRTEADFEGKARARRSGATTGTTRAARCWRRWTRRRPRSAPPRPRWRSPGSWPIRPSPRRWPARPRSSNWTN
jgi:aryl-alcohol dehydrogenase-like predicted oxidoreductase